MSLGDSMGIPIIRMEVEGIRRTMVMALTEHAAQMDEDIKNAVEAYCTPENISRIIHEAAYRALDSAIKDEVTTFFRCGPGRKAVAEAVKDCLLTNKSYTPLDEV